MKKGFTLVEIIISIAIIALIGIIGLFFVFNKEDNNDERLFDLVTDSAAVNYLSNSQNVKRIQENYGYQVYTIDELIKEGLLSEEEINELIKKANENKEEGVDYNKIILWYDWLNEGDITYIYPYRKNVTVFIEQFEDEIFVKGDSNKFSCKKGIEKIYYFDEDYVIQEINDVDNVTLKCKVNQSDEYKDELNLEEGNHKLLYQLSVDGKSYENGEIRRRNVKVYDLNKFKLKASSDSGLITDYNNWYKGPVDINVYYNEDSLDVVSVSNIDEANHSQIGVKWDFFNDGNTKIMADKYLQIGVENSDKYSVSADLNVAGNVINDLTIDNINVDNKNPLISNIRVNDSKISFKVTDEHSGLSKVELINSSGSVIDSKSYTNTLTDNITFNLSSTYNNYYLRVTDMVGNVIEKSFENIVTVSVNPVEGSIFKFNIKVNNFKKVEINFDLPFVREENAERTDETKLNLDQFYKKTRFNREVSEGVDALTETIEFSFIDLVEAIRLWYASIYSRTNRISGIESYLDNLNVECTVNVTDKDNEVSTYKFLITLNAQCQKEAFNSIWFDNGDMESTPIGFNENGDIAFTETRIQNQETLYLKKSGQDLKRLGVADVDSERYSSGSKRTSGIVIFSFDKSYLEYGSYVQYSEQTSMGNWRYYNTNYFYTYNILTGNQTSNVTETVERDTNNDQFVNRISGLVLPLNYNTWPKLSTQTYYQDLSKYLEYYKKFEEINVSNPTAIKISNVLSGYIFEDNGWKSILSTEKTKNNDRTDTILYAYKEEVSIKRID